MKKDKRFRFTVDLPQELYTRLRVYVVHNNVTLKDVVIAGIKQQMGESSISKREEVADPLKMYFRDVPTNGK